MRISKTAVGSGLALSLLSGLVLADGWDPTSAASNKGSISNTRHNLTQSFLQNQNGGLGIAFMNQYRNNYGEVCVYCHTPHGSSMQMGSAPLWNRTKPTGTYKTYDQLGTSTLNGTITQPGANSLTCLSCHDGTVAIDSIINMPGSGGYDANQATSVNTSFLSTFPGAAGTHGTLNDCAYCHVAGAGMGAADFLPFIIGQDLKNDHPVGVKFPTTFGPGVDFNPPTKTSSNGLMNFFDKNGNGRADTNEVRLYNTGEGFEVECASCHDPHGVPSAGGGSLFIPSFLRVANTSSSLCLTCHIK